MYINCLWVYPKGKTHGTPPLSTNVGPPQVPKLCLLDCVHRSNHRYNHHKCELF